MVGGVFRLEKLVDPYTTYFPGICELNLPDQPLLPEKFICYRLHATSYYFFNAALGDNTITI
jgi:hypothetical protein